jgi:hypothetical protein
VDSAKKVIGLGIIARDERGQFLVGKSIQQQMEVESVVAEALAAAQALILC